MATTPESCPFILLDMCALALFSRAQGTHGWAGMWGGTGSNKQNGTLDEDRTHDLGFIRPTL